MLKIELHAHTADDETDWIPHTTRELIAHAAIHGYQGLAITLHDRQLDVAPFEAFARDRGLVLIPGIERTIEGKHLLLINFPREVEGIASFDDLAALKARTRGLVVVPHAFYPLGSALGRTLLDRHAHLVDALEWNAMYSRWIDFNRPAIRWARAHGKPLVGNTDLHRLEQMGTTWSLVDAEPTPDAICDAIRAGRVEVCTTPIPLLRAGWLFTRMTMAGFRRAGSGRQRHGS